MNTNDKDKYRLKSIFKNIVAVFSNGSNNASTPIHDSCDANETDNTLLYEGNEDTTVRVRN